MTVLSAPVELYDIRNVEAFVVDCIKRSGVKLRHESQEWEDLVMTSIAILYDMASKYVDHKDGYTNGGCFSGYAITFLPRKIKAEHFKGQENALMCTQPDGSRKWEFRAKAISYDHIVTPENDSAPTDERKIRQPGDFINPPTVDISFSESFNKAPWEFADAKRDRIDSGRDDS